MNAQRLLLAFMVVLCIGLGLLAPDVGAPVLVATSEHGGSIWRSPGNVIVKFSDGTWEATSVRIFNSGSGTVRFVTTSGAANVSSASFW